MSENKDTTESDEVGKDSTKSKVFDKTKFVEAPLPKTNPWTKNPPAQPPKKEESGKMQCCLLYKIFLFNSNSFLCSINY